MSPPDGSSKAEIVVEVSTHINNYYYFMSSQCIERDWGNKYNGDSVSEDRW